MADFDFSEFQALAADLRAAGSRAEPLARAAVAATATMLQAQAQGAAPVDTGFLRSSISTTNRGLEAEVGPTAHYGIYQEMGTSRMGPQPYLFPALDRVTPMFEAAMAQVIERSLP
ncbi:HK97-gp10 family putative phage morphogenesis protein [Pseudactinotalea sp. Z1732]|uniref:HK97-gp10 family putative phage morphogenesis protein n=1 Tax=Micrococcales TaxID=85006 RepID=UPI003C7B52FB